MIKHVLALFFLPLATMANATSVDIQARGPDGRPLAGAVVTIVSTARKPQPFRLATPPVMAQQNISFQPHVLIVPTGTAVAFPNHDKVRHQVYSFSKTKKFELKLYGKDETHKVTFDKPGVVALGCNIHDAMSGFIVVVDTPFAAQADANGRVSFGDVPAGAATVTVWHPEMRVRGNQFAQALNVSGASLAKTVAP